MGFFKTVQEIFSIGTADMKAKIREIKKEIKKNEEESMPSKIVTYNIIKFDIVDDDQLGLAILYEDENGKAKMWHVYRSDRDFEKVCFINGPSQIFLKLVIDSEGETECFLEMIQLNRGNPL